MKLTFCDSPNISLQDFKRLLMIADEIAFVERPSINLATNYGTVGMPSGIRNLVKEFDGSPVKLIVDEPPTSVFNSDYYKEYFKKDLENPDFLKLIIKGIKDNWIYDYHFDPKTKDCFGEYADYKKWILNNEEEILKTDLISLEPPEEPFRIKTLDEALFAFKIIAAEQSMRVSSVLYTSNKYNLSPISISPSLNSLINLRLSNEVYLGFHSKTRQLGFKMIDCIVPDSALLKIHWTDILLFREKTKDLYHNWAIEINKIESEIFSTKEITNDDIIRLLDTEINPRLREIKNEISRIKDERFMNILKTVKNTFISFVSLSTLSDLSVTGAIASFIGANLKTPKLTDDIINAHFKIKDVKRTDGLTYQLKIQEFIDK